MIEKELIKKILSDIYNISLMDLGRMITLEEVLRAIGKNDYVVDCGGQFWDVTSGGEQAYIEGLPVRWYLGKPLSEQSQEFKEWLCCVLK